jgi:hypothetical protein
VVNTTARSPREQRMANYVEQYPDAPQKAETQAERIARHNRNWQELKKARLAALRQGNSKGVEILDGELKQGRGVDFPEDVDVENADLYAADSRDEHSDLYAVQAPKKPASQGDVRKSEPSMALIEQEADERGFDAAHREFTAKGGALKPGQTQAQAITEATGRRNPAETRTGAEAQHAVDTGELTYGDSVAYNAAKPAAAIAGFAAAGPVGATLADATARGLAIGYNLDAALGKGLDPDQAVNIFANEMLKGVAVDALFNFGTPLAGRAISAVLDKFPRLKGLGPKIHAAIQRRIAGPAPKPELRAARIEKLQEITPDPQRKQAVGELTKRVEGDYVPTAGQVQGKSGFGERRIYEAFPGQFQAQEEALTAAAGKMRNELVDAGSQPTQQKLGQQLDRVVEETVKRTKERLRPVFTEADNLNVVVDFNSVSTIARKALEKDAAAVGKGKLTDAERSHLQGIINSVDVQPWRGAEASLDFSSVQKAVLRKLNPDGKPTPYFTTIVGDMTKAADAAFEEGARRMGQNAVVGKLRAARNDYRIMNDAAYKGAMKQVLTKGEHAPEDLGQYLWSPGKVTRIDELDELLGLAGKEKVASPAALDKMRRNVARGFLQEGVQDLKSAATWSEKLKDPKRRATWEALTRGPSGKALKEGMAVLEHAAQIATVAPANQQSKFLSVPASRAIGGGLGISWVTLGFNPYLATAGVSVAGVMRLMATAHVHGDKGTINLMAKVLRSNSTATAASAKALQQLIPQLQEAADKYNVTDLFMKKEEDVDAEQSEPQ